MKTIVVVFFLLFFLPAFSQTEKSEDSLLVHSLLEQGAGIYVFNLAAAKEKAAQALQRAKNTGDDNLLARCYKSLSFYERKARSALLLHYDSLYLVHAHHANDLSLLLNAHYVYANDLLNQELFAKALLLIENGLRLAEKSEDKDATGHLYNSRGFYHYRQNELKPAAAYFEKSLQLFTETRNEVMVAYSKQWLANVSIYSGNISEKMLDYLSNAIYYYHRNNKPVEEGTCYDILGFAYASLGNHTTAIEHYQKAKALFTGAGYAIKIVDEDLSLAQSYLYRNIADSGQYFLNEAKKRSAAIGYEKGTAAAKALEIQLLTVQKKFEEAGTAAIEAQKKKENPGSKEVALLINEYVVYTKAGKGQNDSVLHYLKSGLSLLKKTYPPEVLSPMIGAALKQAGVTAKGAIADIKQKLGISDKGYTEIKNEWSDETIAALLHAMQNAGATTDTTMQAIYQRQLVEMQEQYGLRLYKDSVTIQQQNLLLASQQIRQRNGLLAAAALLLLFFLLFVFYLHKSRRQANQSRRQAEHLRSVEEQARKEIEELKTEADHRVGNVLNVIVGIIGETKAVTADKPSFDLLEERVEPLLILHRMLQEKASGDVYLQDYFGSICRHLQRSYGGHRHITVEVEANAKMDGKKAGTLGLIVNEIVTNSFKHAFAGRNNGAIRLRLRHQEGKQVLRIADDGPGLLSGTQTGSGLEIMESLAYQLKGELKQYNRNGTNFELIFS